MKYSELNYNELADNLIEIAKTVKLSDNFTFSDMSNLFEEHNLMFFASVDCFTDNELAHINEFKLACFELAEKLNKHFTDTTFYITHSEINTINEYYSIIEYNNLRTF